MEQIWGDAADQRAVTDAANEIEANLRRSPESFGESRFGKERIAIVHPWVVFFEVRESDRMVVVLTLKRIEDAP